MPIIYSLVARGTVVLAEHTDSSGNFITVTHRLLEKIPINEDSKMSYIYDKYAFLLFLLFKLSYFHFYYWIINYQYTFHPIFAIILINVHTHTHKFCNNYYRFIFHYMVEGGITYLCLADDQFGRRIPFSFLDNIKNRFMSTYGRYCQNAMAYAFNAEFSRVLQIQMVSFYYF